MLYVRIHALNLRLPIEKSWDEKILKVKNSAQTTFTRAFQPPEQAPEPQFYGALGGFATETCPNGATDGVSRENRRASDV